MNKISASVGMAIVCAAAMGTAQAASENGTIQFKGAISAESCYLDSSIGDANSVIVNMGTVNSSQVGTVAAPHFTTGAGLSTADFNVVCKNDAQVSLTLKAPQAELVAGNQILRVNNGVKGEGYAQNVGVAVYSSSSSSTAYDLSKEKLLDTQAITAGQSVNVKFAAAYVRSGGQDVAPTAGVANATLPFVLEIQ
ncbi:fimbrial protein [Kerstersia sp.]|uniref:fimbrial protein n=1 Tax=Kerstersia sp. TaxID=1930783 RepID=UPI003F8FD7D5